MQGIELVIKNDARAATTPTGKGTTAASGREVTAQSEPCQSQNPANEASVADASRRLQDTSTSQVPDIMCRETNVSQEPPHNSKASALIAVSKAGGRQGSDFYTGDSFMMDLSLMPRPPLFKPNKVARKGDKNHSHIKHGGYFVDVNYPQEQPNFHNRSGLEPKSFPKRQSTNFVDLNKQYEEMHRFDQLLAMEVHKLEAFK